MLEGKDKRNRRIQEKDRYVQRQFKLAKSRNLPVRDSPHRWASRSCLDCGRTQCGLCGNPRWRYKELTYQEKKIFQDMG